MRRYFFMTAVLALLTWGPAIAEVNASRPAKCSGSNVAVSKVPESYKLAIEISGREQDGGKTLVLDLKFGDQIRSTARIYSEPSHTLLAAAMDAEFAKTPAGIEFERSVSPKPLMTTALNGADFRSSIINERAPTDDRIAIYASGFPQDPGKEHLIADGKVGSGEFHFSTYTDGSDSVRTVHCCSSGSCGQMCVDCPTPAFTCCQAPCYNPERRCCEITCGHVDCCVDLCP